MVFTWTTDQTIVYVRKREKDEIWSEEEMRPGLKFCVSVPGWELRNNLRARVREQET